MKKISHFENKYFDNLSRGGLTIPSSSLAEFVSNGFAILDSADEKCTAFEPGFYTNLLLNMC